jgi:hypothetical protein
MDTKLHIQLGFKLEGVFFGWHEGELYQLPYEKDGRYFPLRTMRKKSNKTGWEYYHIRRKKVGIPKLRAMLQPVDWKVDKPAKL